MQFVDSFVVSMRSFQVFSTSEREETVSFVGLLNYEATGITTIQHN